jgi:hypothetical protein
MSFALYVVGFLIVIAGLIYGAVILHVAAHWIVVGAVVLAGFAILTGVKATRQKDPPA